MDHFVLQNIALIIILAFGAQWFGWKLKVPVIVLLSMFGVIFGPILNLVRPKEVFGDLLPIFIELSVAIILFEGGMTLKIQEFKLQSKGLIRLFSVAVIFNWLFGAALSYYFVNLSWQISLLVSGILIVTGPTVILPALREAKLVKRVSSYLKWEGIINDPIGAILAVLVLQFHLHRNSEFIIFAILKILFIALTVAWITRYLLIIASQRALFPEFLKIPFIIGAVIGLFIISELFQKGSGLLTSTLLGLSIGNINLSSIKDLRRFSESLTVFIVSIIFIILSAGIDLNVWKELSWQHYFLIFSFGFLIRPVSIYLSTFKTGMSFRERILIGIYGPRGIVAASVAGVSSEILIQNNVNEAKIIVPIIFSVILLTVTFHGLLLRPLARKLKLINTGDNGIIIVGATEWSIALANEIKKLNIPIMVTDTSWYQLAQARHEGIETYFGQIIEDRDISGPDLSEYNYLFAFTEDDHYNALVCERLGHEFGHDHVYKLPVIEKEYSLNNKKSKNNFDVKAESNEALYENMMQKKHYGWRFKSLKLSETNTFSDFLASKDLNEYIILLVIRSNNRVLLYSQDSYKEPSNDDIIIYFEK